MDVYVVSFEYRDLNLFKDALKIRRNVFIEEQNVPEKIEIDGHDNISVHFIIYIDDIPAGTCRTRRVDIGTWKLERFAVLKDFRTKGIGTELIKSVENKAANSGIKQIIMNAQSDAVEFYIKNGYRIISDEEFYEAGIRHLRMHKSIPKITEN